MIGWGWSLSVSFPPFKNHPWFLSANIKCQEKITVANVITRAGCFSSQRDLQRFETHFITSKTATVFPTILVYTPRGVIFRGNLKLSVPRNCSCKIMREDLPANCCYCIIYGKIGEKKRLHYVLLIKIMIIMQRRLKYLKIMIVFLFLIRH